MFITLKVHCSTLIAPSRFFPFVIGSFLLFANLIPLVAQTSTNFPNVLFIITDDHGVDVTNGYHNGNLMPITPTLDSLRSVGITFDNVFSAPKCTPSRASIMSGKHGIKTGVLGTPGHLDTAHVSLFRTLAAQTNDAYATAVIGKWHISNPSDPTHPRQHGVDFYTGLLGAGVNDYNAWNHTLNDTTFVDSNYVTSVLTDASVDWINAQTQPWLLWLAHAAPHAPYHVPPVHMYSVPNPTNNYRQYLAMIESVDYETNRLLNSIPNSVLANTIIIIIGDNGTPNNVLQDYPAGHGKGTVYQGGIRVPMIIAGNGVRRLGEREPALVNILDIHATILELAGGDLPGGIHNSLSFKPLLSGEACPTRDYNYSEIKNSGIDAFTIRGPRYKLIQDINSSQQEFYDLLLDSLEFNNIIDSVLSADEIEIKNDLLAEADQIRFNWSCRDHIQNGDEEGIDCGGSQCIPCVSSAIDLQLDSNSITLFPNPTASVFELHGLIENYTIQIMNSMGVVLQTFHSQGSSLQFDLSHLPPSYYFISVTNTANELICVRKIIKVD